MSPSEKRDLAYTAVFMLVLLAIAFVLDRTLFQPL